MKYLEVSEEVAKDIFMLNHNVIIAVYRGVYGNDYVKEVVVHRNNINETWYSKKLEVVKQLDDNLHYTFKYYSIVE